MTLIIHHTFQIKYHVFFNPLVTTFYHQLTPFIFYPQYLSLFCMFIITYVFLHTLICIYLCKYFILPQYCMCYYLFQFIPSKQHIYSLCILLLLNQYYRENVCSIGYTTHIMYFIYVYYSTNIYYLEKKLKKCALVMIRTHFEPTLKHYYASLNNGFTVTAIPPTVNHCL